MSEDKCPKNTAFFGDGGHSWCYSNQRSTDWEDVYECLKGCGAIKTEPRYSNKSYWT